MHPSSTKKPRAQGLENAQLEHLQQQHLQAMRELNQRHQEQEAATRKELAAATQKLHDLAAKHQADMAELHKAKQLPLQTGTQPDWKGVLPVHVLCEAIDAELQEALDRGGRCTFQWDYRTAAIAVDDAIQDPRVDPFVRVGGQITGVQQQHPVLVELAEKYGQSVAALVVAKKREMDPYRKSVQGPTPMLWAGGKVLRLGKAVEQLLKTVKGQAARGQHAGGSAGMGVAATGAMADRGESGRQEPHPKTATAAAASAKQAYAPFTIAPAATTSRSSSSSSSTTSSNNNKGKNSDGEEESRAGDMGGQDDDADGW